MSFSALILAGSRPGEDASAIFEGVAHKALIEVEGQILLERVVSAVREAGAETIAVSCNQGSVADFARSLDVQIVPAAAGPSGSVLTAFEALGAPMLVTTADHALLESVWITDLVAETPDEADLSLMLAKREAIEDAMPGSRRTYLKFADGHWSGCNLFYLQSVKSRAAIELWQRIEADRKRPWRIATRLGMGTLVSYALGRLKLSDGLAQLGGRVGIEVALVPAKNGLAAVDVDKPQDLADVRALLARR